MSATNVPPNLESVIRGVNRRLDELERRLRAQPTQFSPETIHSWWGPLEIAISGVSTRRDPAQLVTIDAHLDVAGTTDTTVEVLKNGDVIATVVIPATLLTVNVPCSVRFDTGDRLQDRVTVVGSGATSLTVHHRWGEAIS